MRDRPTVAVYAIARDEEPHVEGWVDAAAAADVIVLADTGSTDSTADAARSLGITVTTVAVEPFRFDDARNLALSAVPAEVDVCISVDLDERLRPGWRQVLDTAWQHTDARLLRARLSWQWRPDLAARTWSVYRIHARSAYRWSGAVHERLEPHDDHTEITAPIIDVWIDHQRDPAAARPTYLPLLELTVRERPDDPRWLMMLALEHCAHGRLPEATKGLRQVLQLPATTNERLHSLLLLAALDATNRPLLLVQACAEYPDRREPWVALHRHHLDRGNRPAAHRTLLRAYTATTADVDDYLADPTLPNGDQPGPHPAHA